MKNVQICLLLILNILLYGCAGYIPYGTAALEINEDINFEVNTFEIIQSSDLRVTYKNHFNQRILDKFKSTLGKKLEANGLSEAEQPDVQLKITEFNLVNSEIETLTIDIVSRGKTYRTIEYRPKVGPGYYQGVTYFRRTPGISMAADIVVESLMRRFKR